MDDLIEKLLHGAAHVGGMYDLPEEADAMKAAAAELSELRAFKAACEGQQAAAEIGQHGFNWTEYGFNTHTPLGTKFYIHPDLEAAQLRMLVAELEATLHDRDDDLRSMAAHIRNLSRDVPHVTRPHVAFRFLQETCDEYIAKSSRPTALTALVEKTKRVSDLERQLANDIHTCGPNCQRPGCVARRERDQQLATLTEQRDLAVEALRKMNRAYVSIMENGRDRITMLGGECDPVDVMELADPALIESKKALAAIQSAEVTK